jgi:hypothetical protein
LTTFFHKILWGKAAVSKFSRIDRYFFVLRLFFTTKTFSFNTKKRATKILVLKKGYSMKSLQTHSNDEKINLFCWNSHEKLAYNISSYMLYQAFVFQPNVLYYFIFYILPCFHSLCSVDLDSTEISLNMVKQRWQTPNISLETCCLNVNLYYF